jgi:hypothetical protein
MRSGSNALNSKYRRELWREDANLACNGGTEKTEHGVNRTDL